MKKFLFEKYPISLPKRNYDICQYAGYVESIIGKKREDEFCCHCFALFNDELTEIVAEHLKQHPQCDYCIEPIFEDELINDDDDE